MWKSKSATVEGRDEIEKNVWRNNKKDILLSKCGILCQYWKGLGNIRTFLSIVLNPVTKNVLNLKIQLCSLYCLLFYIQQLLLKFVLLQALNKYN